MPQVTGKVRDRKLDLVRAGRPAINATFAERAGVAATA
jgi:hypothetical protein